MNKQHNHYRVLSLFLFLFTAAAALGQGFEKKKNISRTFNVSPTEKLSITNSFGDVAVTTWDKNVFQIDIDISVGAPTDEKAQQMLDRIEIRENKLGDEISFKTENKVNNSGKGNYEMHINYKIYMPTGNPLTIENSFGAINVPDRKGLTNLISKFGKLIAGKLDRCDNILVEFGKANIKSVSNCKLNFKYSGSSGTTNVSGIMKVNVEFSGGIRLSIDNALEQLSVSESYSDLRLNVTPDLEASFDIHTNFGDFKNTSSLKIEEEKDEDGNEYAPKFDKDYKGVNGSGKAKIKIKSSFGSLHIAKPSDPDETKKRKNKSRNSEEEDDID